MDSKHALLHTPQGVHEYGWNLERAPDGEVRWFRPGGVRYRAGPIAA